MTNKQEVEEFCKEYDLTEEQFYGRENIERGLNLCFLTFIPKGFNPTVGGGLGFFRLTSIPEWFRLVVRDYLYLGSLTSIPEGFNPTVGGSLNLNGLTSIPEGFKPTVGGDLYLNGLTSIPEGFKPTVGGSLSLNGLTSVPEGFNPTVGRRLDLGGVAHIPEVFNPAVGDTIKYKTGTVPSKNKPVYPLTWRDGKYMLADGILCEVLKRKGNVYRVKLVGKKEEAYLVTDGTSWSHGETLDKAREDLKYKVQPRDLSEYSNVTVDTEFSFEEAVAFYRTVTGACSLGIRRFAEFKCLDTDRSYAVGDMLELAKGKYGEENLKHFLTKKAGNNDKR